MKKCLSVVIPCFNEEPRVLSCITRVLSEEVVEEVDVAIFRLNSIEDSIKEHSPAIAELEKSLAIANDQMRTIMSDHEYMGEMLEDMGKTQPAGERRSYGGY